MAGVDQLLSKKVDDRYLKREVLGEGTYGVVYKAIDAKTGQTVAIKKIRLGKQKEGVNFTALREIKLLNELKDPNIIQLIDAFPHKGICTLSVILDRNIVLSPADIKSYIQMTLRGLAFCHWKWVLHRDMKPNNLLIWPGGLLRLADFGLARLFGSPDWRFTHQVFARWCRAPELLFGAKQYGPGVDVWAAACITTFTDIDQLGKIFAAFGTPKPLQWPDMVYLPDYVEYQHVPGQPLHTLFPMASDDALYFSSIPLSTEPALLPRPPPKRDSINSKVSNFNPQDSPTVLSPPRKLRRVMPHREGFDVNAHQMDEMDDHGHEIRQTAGEKSGYAPTSLDFSIFGMKPTIRPTINRKHKKETMKLYFRKENWDQQLHSFTNLNPCNFFFVCTFAAFEMLHEFFVRSPCLNLCLY
ncbi:hypothetical protein Pfo_020409 [Paulownia fortunei]|nr:hypothetical protein Pfo_020409 [Paulownia fortunei]